MPCGYEVMFRRKVDWYENNGFQQLGQPIKPLQLANMVGRMRSERRSSAAVSGRRAHRGRKQPNNWNLTSIRTIGI
jgi:hypothetical protein